MNQVDTARLIDSHVHIWDPTVLEYSWLEGELDRPYLPADYQAGARTTLRDRPGLVGAPQDSG